MSSDLAAKLGFAVGSVSVGGKSRTLIAEFSRTATVTVGPRSARYGVAVRLVVSVTSLDMQGALTIPLLAAEAQLGRTQASVNLTVRGYAGDGVAELLPTHILTLNVDTYSEVLGSLHKIVTLVGHDRANIRPELLWLEAEDKGPVAIEDELTRAVGAAFALTQIEGRRPLEDSLNSYQDEDDIVAQEEIRDVYAALVPGGDHERIDEASRRAHRLLDDYRLRGRGLFG